MSRNIAIRGVVYSISKSSWGNWYHLEIHDKVGAFKKAKASHVMVSASPRKGRSVRQAAINALNRIEGKIK